LEALVSEAATWHIPRFLTRCANDEFVPPPLNDVERNAAILSAAAIEAAIERLRMSAEDFIASRRGIATGLLGVNRANAANGEDFFAVPDYATVDAEAADDALGGDELIIDVQTHYIANRPACESNRQLIKTLFPGYGPDWWDGLPQAAALDFVDYLRCVYLESDTAVAVLSSAPGISDERMLFNHEMAGTRLLLERLGARDRMLNHAVVHPDIDGELSRMPEVVDRIGPAGWKVYTLGATTLSDFGKIKGWYLDDDLGIQFLESVRASGVKLVCAHKGLSGLIDTGSPRDFGPAATMFPDINFVAYHSGFEPGEGEPTNETREGPYTEATAHLGVNRLVHSLRESNIAPGSNVYAELGTTWYCLIKRPVEAAHVLGKLLNAVGPDNVLWGTDAIWYGPTQAAVDTFRAFEIPAWMRDAFGYPELTPELKAKILGLNAAQVYDIDIDTARSNMGADDMAWARAAMEEFRATGTPTV
jgi:predicted TIM-barrel fold metal-dependent hydrolase